MTNNEDDRKPRSPNNEWLFYKIESRGDGFRINTPMTKSDFGQSVRSYFGITNVPELYPRSPYLYIRT